MLLLILVTLGVICAVVYVKTKKKQVAEQLIEQPKGSENWDVLDEAINQQPVIEELKTTVKKTKKAVQKKAPVKKTTKTTK